MRAHAPTQLWLFPDVAPKRGLFADAVAELRRWRRRHAALFRYGRNS